MKSAPALDRLVEIVASAGAFSLEPDLPAALRTRTDDCGLRVMVAMRAFEGGGAQRDMVLLCNALAAKGVELTILVLRDEGPLKALLHPLVRVAGIPGRKLRYAVPGLRRAIAAAPADLVVSSEAALNLCALLAVRALPARRRPKLVLREVGSPSIALHRDPYRQNRVAYRILRHLYRGADRIIALTDGARGDLAQNFFVSEAKISVMGTNAVIPPATARRLSSWDGESGRESDLVVSVGRLSPEKDHRTLIRAMSLVPRHLPWRLALIGEGPERPHLETLARQSGIAERTLFTGYVGDPFAFMMRARLAVCSSVYEGFGNAIVEALACGTPVVSTDAPYGPREILANGRYGALTPVGDAAALAGAIEAALQGVADRRALMARGLEYTAAAAADRFLEIAADLLARPIGAAPPLAPREAFHA